MEVFPDLISFFFGSCCGKERENERERKREGEIEKMGEGACVRARGRESVCEPGEVERGGMRKREEG